MTWSLGSQTFGAFQSDSVGTAAQDSYVGSVERQHQEQWIRDTDGLVAQWRSM